MAEEELIEDLDSLGGLALPDQGGGEIALGVGEAKAQDAGEQDTGLFEGPALGLAGLVGNTLQGHGLGR